MATKDGLLPGRFFPRKIILWFLVWGNGNFVVTIGIYFHIPFCQAKCNYCHFVSLPFSARTAEKYEKAVIREMNSFAGSSPQRSAVDSIYFGGGTPTLVPAEQVAALLGSCRRLFSVLPECEISLEANPGTLSPEKIGVFHRSGVNRVSLGAQSFNDHELLSIGRLHTADMISKSISLLHLGGLTNMNLDLMLGIPGQTADSWRRNLQEVRRLDVPHLSVYMLDLDEQCPLSSLVDSGKVRIPEEDLIADLYLETISFLSQCGYVQYEISNFAKPGFACRHNLKYWQREPVCGFGLGSHSFDGGSRYSNLSQIDDYFDAIKAGKSAVSWREPVASDRSLAESLFLGLRLTCGVNWEMLQGIYGRENMKQYESGMRALSERGLVEWKESTVRLTHSGMLLSNEVFQLFV